MIDENCVPWLIEINSSPAMDYSTHVTEQLVKEVLEDVIKVTVDLNFAKAKDKASIHTGHFTNILRR